MNFNNWEDFFKDIPFTFFRTSLIQEKYIDTILTEVKNIRATTSKKIKLLEIAGGSGYTSAVLQDLFKNDKNIEIYYSDLSYNLCTMVSDKFGLKTLVADSLNIDCGFHDYDIIYHQGFLEHFNDDLIIKFLKEQSRAAQTLIFDVPNNRRNKKVQEFGNERFLSHKQWQKLAKQANLQIEKVTARRFSNWWKKYMPKVIYDSEYFQSHFGESTIIVANSIYSQKVTNPDDKNRIQMTLKEVPLTEQQVNALTIGNGKIPDPQ